MQLRLVNPPRAFPAARQARARAARAAKPAWRLGPLGFGYVAALADALAIIGAALGDGAAAHRDSGGGLGGLRTGFDVGLIVAVLVVLAGLHGGGYAPSRYADRAGQFARAFPLWNLTALAALALGVATRAIGDFPRVGLALFYLLGLVALDVDARALARRRSSPLHARGLVTPRRIAVVGFEREIDELELPDGAVVGGAQFVCRFALREADLFFGEDLALAVAGASACTAPTTSSSLCPGRAAELIDAAPPR